MSAIITVPVTKGNTTINIDTEILPEKYYVAALTSGLKTLVNGGTTKIIKPKVQTPEAMAAYHAEAIAKAQERVEAMMAGKLKVGRAAAEAGPSGAVMTEARRLARQLVKDTLREAGQKVSHYKASEITAAANQLLASPDGKSLITQAEENLTSRKPVVKVDISKIKEDPELIAKDLAAKEAKAEAKAAGAGVLSAKQAGKVAPRATKH